MAVFNTLKEAFRVAHEDFKAYRRGERRVAPRGHSGRIYQKKDGSIDNSGTNVEIGSSPKVDLVVTVIRKDGTTEIVPNVKTKFKKLLRS